METKFEIYYPKVYKELKQGNSQGIIIDKIFSNEENEYLDIMSLCDSCINDGFAEKGTVQTYGSQQSLKLSQTARYYKNYQDFKNHSMKPNIISVGNITVTGGSNIQIFSPNAKIETSENALNQLENMIELLRHNSNMDNILKAKLIDMNEELQALINDSEKSKLPIIDNLVSLAANFSSLYGLIK